MVHIIRKPHGPVAQAGSMTYPQGPRTQIIGFLGPNTIIFIVFGP